MTMQCRDPEKLTGDQVREAILIIDVMRSMNPTTAAARSSPDPASGLTAIKGAKK